MADNQLAHNFAAQMQHFNQRAELALDADQFRYGIMVHARLDNPYIPGATCSVAAITQSVEHAADNVRRSGGMPTSRRALGTVLVCVAATVGINLVLLLKTETGNRVKIVNNILSEVTGALAAIGVTAVLIKNICKSLGPILRKLTEKNAESIAQTFLKTFVDGLAALGGAVLALLSQVMEWMTAMWRSFRASDPVEALAHRQRASNAFSIDAALRSLASVFSCEVVSHLMAGATSATLAGPLPVVLAPLVSVVVITIVQHYLNRALEAKDHAGGYLPFITSLLRDDSHNGVPRWHSAELQEFGRDITPRLRCALTDRLVVKPVFGFGNIYEREALFHHLRDNPFDPEAFVRADPSNYRPWPRAERLAREVATLLGATVQYD